ncbi:MAG: OmpA family protein [Magnetospirillum sp. WYHS-4]
MIEARRHIRSRLLTAAGAGALVIAAMGTASAQYSDSVVVDYSVIDGGRAGGLSGAPVLGVTTYSGPSYGGGQLRMPGSAIPQSQFYPPAGLTMPQASGGAASVSDFAPPPRTTAEPRRKKKEAVPQQVARAPAPQAKIDVPAAPPAPPAKPAIELPSAPPAAPEPPAAKRPSAPPAPLEPPAPPVRKAEPPPAPKPVAPPAPPALKKVEPTQPTELARVEPKSTSTAPPAGSEAVSGTVAHKVVFQGEGASVPAASKDSLKALSDKINANEEQRLQLVAYASGPAVTPSSARRLSLSRALAVRSLLIDNGVRSTRIDVRALGDKPAGEPANRVDVMIVDR